MYLEGTMWVARSLHEVVVGGRRTVAVVIGILAPLFVCIVDIEYGSNDLVGGIGWNVVYSLCVVGCA